MGQRVTAKRWGVLPLQEIQIIFSGTFALKLSYLCECIIRLRQTTLTQNSFAARLPDRCAAINRKLGGPVVASPKPKLPRAASTPNLLSRPGAATKRPVPAKPRRSLQRVLTDKRERRSVSSGSGRSISLMRSATAPVVLGLKREASETPSLRSIPFADAQPVQASRGGVLNSKRFSRREVDMSSLVPKVASKRNTQVNIEAELREAISALKKPNRELAGRALAETAEKRSTLAPHARSRFRPDLTRDYTDRPQNPRSQFTTRSSKACRSPPPPRLAGVRTFSQTRSGAAFFEL